MTSEARNADNLDCLVRLWQSREETLKKASVLVKDNKSLSQSLDWMADAYGQCARELHQSNAELSGKGSRREDG